jgi:hypothetical protein
MDMLNPFLLLLQDKNSLQIGAIVARVQNCEIRKEYNWIFFDGILGHEKLN